MILNPEEIYTSVNGHGYFYSRPIGMGFVLQVYTMEEYFQTLNTDRSSEIFEVWLEDPSGWHEPAHKHHLDIFVLFYRFSSPRLLFRFFILEATLESYIRQVATTLTHV